MTVLEFDRYFDSYGFGTSDESPYDPQDKLTVLDCIDGPERSLRWDRIVGPLIFVASGAMQAPLSVWATHPGIHVDVEGLADEIETDLQEEHVAQLRAQYDLWTE